MTPSAPRATASSKNASSAAWDPASGRYETVCKIGTGFKDVDLEALNERLDPHLSPAATPEVAVLLEPDVHFQPAVVAEIRGAELSRSPVHTCGATPQGGLALRFPRFVRWREDKGPREATTTDEVVALFERRRAPQS